MKVTFVTGVSPNFMKKAPIIHLLQKVLVEGKDKRNYLGQNSKILVTDLGVNSKLWNREIVERIITCIFRINSFQAN